jgi:hypothetical protein
MHEEEQLERDSANPDRLLPGELSESLDGEDMSHWIQVYEELLVMKVKLAATLQDSLGRMGEAAHAEASAIDDSLLSLQTARFERRLQFWKDRRQHVGQEAVIA